ncbi:MAG TPA: class I SAM-dependent methyltransferase [Herpetosiphonaceae bacterium]|nr:class I SAM-dependent methyltransferase [Herpetosiphonaceae bacterium]
MSAALYIRQLWRIVRPWLRKLVAMAGIVTLAKVAIQIAIQIRPRITPPGAGFILHSAARRRYRNFDRTLRPLQLQNGLRVLEVGGGTGAFTIPLADAVGSSGSVYSIEVQGGMLEQQEQRIRASGVTNAWLYQADALALPFANAAFDRAVVIACLPMLSDKQRALRELRRVLKPDGLLLVSEELIEPEYVPVGVTRRWCTQAGFQQVAVHRELFFYVLVFRNRHDE